VSLRLPWMIPALFVACRWARQFALFEQLQKPSDYILILEDKFLNDHIPSDLSVHNERELKPALLQHTNFAPGGWEHSYHKPDAQWRWGLLSRNAVWIILLLIITLVVTFAPQEIKSTQSSNLTALHLELCQ
jgi:hypothetical protein